MSSLIDSIIGGGHPLSCNCFTCLVVKATDKLPLTDISLDFETPGVKREDIVVKFQGEYLIIQWTSRQHHLKSHKQYAPEMYYDRKAVVCKYENGLLSVRLPLLKQPKPPPDKEINIEIK